MKTLVAILALVVSTAYAQPLNRAATQTSLNSSGQPLTLGLKSTAEVIHLFNTDPKAQTSDAAKDLAPILHAGQRVYDWINALNQSRGANPLSYSDPATTTSPTMEKPKLYNAAYAQQLYRDVQAKMPADYRAVVEGSTPFPATTVVDEKMFIALGLDVSKAYDTAVRWIMMQDYLGYYETQRIMDLRGYYVLSNMIGRDQKLNSFDKLRAAEQAKIHTALVGMCVNNQGFASYSKEACEQDVTQAEAAHSLTQYYASKVDRSKENWASLFELYDDSIRTDLTWTSSEPNVLHYPFLAPTNPVIATYLKSNVEDEWRLGPWRLQIDFQSTQPSPDLSHLEYQANVTPHEETNKIVMDQNEPLTEYLTQWTIRHEFGHLLGFKDCYVEFYDADQKAMVNYAIDPSNLMCSRLGHLQQQHFDVLKRTYFR